MADIKNGRFMRCVDKDSNEYIDIPLAEHGRFEDYGEIAKRSQYFNNKSSLLEDNFKCDYWYTLYFKDGNIYDHPNFQSLLGVVGIDYVGFVINPDNMKIKSAIFIGLDEVANIFSDQLDVLKEKLKESVEERCFIVNTNE